MTQNYIVMYRPSLLEDGELEAIQKSFPSMTQSRMNIRSGDLVIGRCCMVPFYNEVARDIEIAGGRVINSYQQHQYAANLGEYITDLEGLTPTTWRSLAEVPKDGGPFVLKGETNSKKHDWKRFMYAPDWQSAGEIYTRLTQDGLVGEQKIYIRQYVPLMKLGEAIGGCPISKEFRFFLYKGKILSGGFYWHSFREDILEQGGEIPDLSEVPNGFLKEVVRRIWDKIPFVVIDVAQGADGRWWVIELNDGQQSGLSANDPNILFGNLRQALDAEYGAYSIPTSVG